MTLQNWAFLRADGITRGSLLADNIFNRKCVTVGHGRKKGPGVADTCQSLHSSHVVWSAHFSISANRILHNLRRVIT